MVLIADGGATKTNWCLIDNTGVMAFFETEGYHPFFVGSNYIYESLNKNLPERVKGNARKVHHLFFYSAGGGYSKETDNILINGLIKFFDQADIHIETDLLAAARSLLQDKEGFAAILGTGTNTCLYDGAKVVKNIESLGFLLGDEGSGSYIGKKIIGDYVRDAMPETVREAFFNTFQLTPVELLNKVYEHPVANRYCASYARFVGNHIHENPYYHNVVYQVFHDFFRQIVMKYENYNKYTFHCVGSIAYHFKSILAKVATEHGMKMGNIVQDPLEGLVEYHLKRLQIRKNSK